MSCKYRLIAAAPGLHVPISVQLQRPVIYLAGSGWQMCHAVGHVTAYTSPAYGVAALVSGYRAKYVLRRRTSTSFQRRMGRAQRTTDHGEAATAPNHWLRNVKNDQAKATTQCTPLPSVDYPKTLGQDPAT